jgi:hypothetical protein
VNKGRPVSRTNKEPEANDLKSYRKDRLIKCMSINWAIGMPVR